MAWARIDDGFHDHPKVDALSLAAVGLWTLCLSHAHRHRRTALIQGHVTDARVKKIAGKQAHALVTELLAAGLWEAEDGVGGWVIHDFVDYLPKDRDPEERRAAGRKGAAKRWEAAGKLPASEMAGDSSRASAPAFPSRPVPEGTNTGGGDRPVTLRQAVATEPPRKPTSSCTRHPYGNPTDENCGGCRADKESREKRADRNAEQERRELEALARACTECDGVWVLDDEKRPTRRKCDHRSGVSV